MAHPSLKIYRQLLVSKHASVNDTKETHCFGGGAGIKVKRELVENRKEISRSGTTTNEKGGGVNTSKYIKCTYLKC